MFFEDMREAIVAVVLLDRRLLAGEEWHRPRPHLLHPGILSPSPSCMLMLYETIQWSRFGFIARAASKES
jgi:hypothetical protein